MRCRHRVAAGRTNGRGWRSRPVESAAVLRIGTCRRRRMGDTFYAKIPRPHWTASFRGDPAGGLPRAPIAWRDVDPGSTMVPHLPSCLTGDFCRPAFPVDVTRSGPAALSGYSQHKVGPAVAKRRWSSGGPAPRGPDRAPRDSRGPDCAGTRGGNAARDGSEESWNDSSRESPGP
jgi:hypothetical protein